MLITLNSSILVANYYGTCNLNYATKQTVTLITALQLILEEVNGLFHIKNC